MGSSLQISSWIIAIGGGVISLLLAIIAVFLSRLLSQFDSLTIQVSILNGTMKEMDKDLSGEVGILRTRMSAVEVGLEDLDPLWDRTRKCEDRLTRIESKSSSERIQYGG